VRQHLPESCKLTAFLEVVSWVVFFATFAVLILGPPGGPLLLCKTLDTYSSECPAREKLDRCLQSALFLCWQFVCPAASSKDDSVCDFFSFCRGKFGRVGFAWVEAAIAFARFFICSLSATCSFAST
jgi:hypothetical protein